MASRNLNASSQFTNNTNTTDKWILCTGSWPHNTLQLALCLFLLVFSLVGNVLIVAVFCRDKTLRTAVNYFIVNMCVSDLMCPSVNLPIIIISTYDKNLLIFCEFTSIVFSISVLVSLFSMTALAVERFRAIIFPMKPALFSYRRSCAAITTMWISSILFSMFHVGDSLSWNEFYDCLKSELKSQRWFLVYIFLALVCLSVIVVTICYSKMAIFLHRQKNSLHLASEVVKKRAKRNRKIITMLIIIVILFYVAWVPYFVLQYLLYAKISSLPCVYVWLAAHILPFVNPLANPVVYFVFNEKYRQGFMKILNCQ